MQRRKNFINRYPNILLPIFLFMFFINGYYLVQANEQTHKGSKGESIMPIKKSHDPLEYEKLWKEVEDLMYQGKPKSALKVVEKIYSTAKQNKDSGNFIKAILHKMRFLQEVEEDAFEKAQKQFLKEIRTSEFPIKQILHSMLAEQYWYYYQIHRWHLLSQSRVDTEYKTDDIFTWDAKKLVEEILYHYRESLTEAEQSKKNRINLFDEILLKSSQSRRFRPTLFDFLAHRAIDFFMNNEAGLTRPTYQFTISNPEFFQDTHRFAQLELFTKDKLSFHFNALQYLQELIKFHLHDENPEALVDVDLKRLAFIYKNAVISNKEIIYEKILREMLEKYNQLPIAAEIYFEMGQLYHQLGNQYNAGLPEKYRWYKKKAHQLCQEAIKKYPDSIGAKNCQKLIRQIEEKYLQLTLEKAEPCNQSFRGLLKYTNIQHAYIKIVKTNHQELKNKNRLNRLDMVNYFIKKPGAKEWELKIPKNQDYQPHSSEIKFDSLEGGEYLVLMSDSPGFDLKKNIVTYSHLTISDIAFIHRNRGKMGLEFYILNRSSGLPLTNIQAQVWHRAYDRTSRQYIEKKGKLFLSDKNGYFNIPFGSVPERHIYIEIINKNGEDRLFIDSNFYLYQPYESRKKEIRTLFFTDRSIYRPGQTVYFKGIILHLDSQNSEDNKILTNYKTQVTLFDVNMQKISHLDLETNEFGTFSGTFQLPMGRLNGNMRISDKYGSAYFSMEEYKRPKFEVNFLTPEKTYHLNDNVIVKGEATAFAGYSLDQAIVKYRVERKVFYPYSWDFGEYYEEYWPIKRSEPMEIVNGISQTDDRGAFEIEFKAIPDLSIDEGKQPAFCFTIYADVTDINGETQTSKKQVIIGYTSLKLNMFIAEQLDKRQKEHQVFIDSTDLSGNFIKAKGEIIIYKLLEPEKIFRRRLWQKPDQFIINKDDFYSNFPHDVFNDEDNFTNWEKVKKVLNISFDTGEQKQFKLSQLKKWEPGKYVAQMVSKDKDGNKIKEIKYFTVFDSKEKELPYPMLDWFAVPKIQVEPGENATFIMGSSAKNVHVVYQIEHRGKIIDSHFLVINNEQKIVHIPIREEHRGNLGIHLTFVQYNRLINHSFNFQVPWTNKNLDLSFESFRDRLQPGEQEEWKIKICGPHGEKPAAEMVASLYDASLDTFRKHLWNFNIFPYHHFRYSWNKNNYFNPIISTSIGKPQEYFSILSKHYDQLNWFGFTWNDMNLYFDMGVEGGVVGGVTSSLDGAPAAAPPHQSSPMVKRMKSETLDEEITNGDETFSGKKKDGNDVPPLETKNLDTPEIKIRKNFNETAFFYPQLKTNSQGEIIISFTVPESLTRWKMMGFAHTQNLQFGFINNQLVTQKKLMVIPNTPRFFREGDTIVYTAKVTNLSDEELSGSVQLQLLDAVTLKPVDASFKVQQLEKPFKALKGKSDRVSWKLEIPENLEAVTYRLIARAGKFSDGEEQIVPILRNRMLVTESIPLPVKAKESKTFQFKKLINSSKSKTLKHHRLTLEFTSNPVWYVIQAIPYLIEFPYECMEQIFSRFYANSIATYIMNANPKIKRVFDLWKSASPGSANANALISNLEKNQELKTLLLEETPWVLDGQDETQRKQRLALLFDLNTLSNNLDSALNKLKEGQLPSGAWPWFKGMYESRYITQYIVCGFAHLQQLKILDTKENKMIGDMLKNAIPYTDKKLSEDYQWLIKEKIDLQRNNLKNIHIHYFYARSYFPEIPMDKRDLNAFAYYKDQIKQYWVDYKNNKYLQGMMALILNRYNEIDTAVSIVESLKEHALYSEEMGMYWKSNYGYYWYQAPIETHALLIEAFAEITKDFKSVNLLKTWLLKQKQTQDWGSTKATAETCYALLLKGKDWLMEEQSPEITLGKSNPIVIIPGKMNKKNERIETESGTGYFKTSWAENKIIPDMGNIDIKNNNNIAAWGSLYWQYFEQLDKITPAKTPLSIKKKLFVEKPSDTGPVIYPLDNSSNLSIGDKIKVRIELKVDRNMEYVHMKDMRASCLEPLDVLSGYRWQSGLGYYQSTKDASTHFFFDYLPKGKYIFEYSLRVTHQGNYSNGITSIQCMYAPEFTSHSEGIRIKVRK